VADRVPRGLDDEVQRCTAPISQVEVAVNRSVHVADLDPSPVGRWAWHGWYWTWSGEPGEHVLTCRATDAAGNV
jgi:hypothetical protein